VRERWVPGKTQSGALEVRQMSHPYAQNITHLVFSTKERRKLISTELQSALWAYVAGICKRSEIFVHAVGGMDDHIHSLIQNGRKATERSVSARQMFQMWSNTYETRRRIIGR
jgi:REP element-mobilizing transposase RayT